MPLIALRFNQKAIQLENNFVNSQLILDDI